MSSDTLPYHTLMDFSKWCCMPKKSFTETVDIYGGICSQITTDPLLTQIFSSEMKGALHNTGVSALVNTRLVNTLMHTVHMLN